MGILEEFSRLHAPLLAASREYYGERLISLVVFGSVGRGVPGPDSDVDCLLVVDPLPDGRIPRVTEFSAVENALAHHLDDLRTKSLFVEISPVFKTPGEMQRGSPLLLDMVDDALVLFDRDEFFAHEIADLRKRLEARAARRVWVGNAWYWDLKPDYQPGEVFEI